MTEAAQACDGLFREIVGKPVSHVWRGHGSMIGIELGELTQRFKRDGTKAGFDGEVSLMVEWDWRLESNTRILCGSSGSMELWLPLLERLVGARVVSCELSGKLPEIMMAVDSGLRVLSFACVESDPCWTLFDRRGAGPVTWFYVRNGQLVCETGTEM